MDKTIKQLADAYGLSKQAIQYHVKKLPKTCWYFDTKQGSKTIMVKPEGQDYIFVQANKKQINESIKFATKFDTLELQHKLNMVELENKNYKERLEILEKQNKEQGQRIDTLMQLVDQAQQLQAMAEQKIKMLEQKEPIVENPVEEPVKEPKKKWWKFF